ncbi:MAG: hypothetical protein ACD_9C00239G0006 [uncultured bacterium]|nr:MAG: hypothetical protein ACD_9C00239G0006 [uncultured bacterium]
MKIIGPLHSEKASGTFGDLLTFSERNTGAQVRFQKKQKDKITSARTEQRNKFLIAREMWHLHDFGKIEFGFNMAGGQRVNISSLPIEKRAPQFARFVSDVLNFYL